MSRSCPLVLELEILEITAALARDCGAGGVGAAVADAAAALGLAAPDLGGIIG